MNILLVSATAAEVAPFVASHGETPGPGRSLCSFSCYGKATDLLVTGIGIAGAAVHTARQLERKRYDLALNAGIAGSFTPGFPIGSVALVADERFGDLGVEEAGRFTPFFDLGLADPEAFPFKGGRLVNPHLNQFLSTFPSPPWSSSPAHGITRDRIRQGNPGDNGDADFESMEGAAFHYACLTAGVPFLQVRAVSNVAGDRDRTRWRIGEAVGNLCAALEVLLQNVPSRG